MKKINDDLENRKHGGGSGNTYGSGKQNANDDSGNKTIGDSNSGVNSDMQAVI